ncbi:MULTISPECIES: hypothetical protein [Shewanella]|uniref:Uncharacterized protein n=1 Tax=Shewanella psychromarinicola TaxID=2487742 RepID=A0ABM7BY39_9GAMM|nr:hypothetical protein [Shewanella psychromarinicola]AZG35078.1 hypothetical protein EGC80_09215 [Shewanella psychromarinicola]MCL1082728.1 hypothetical protein [Shewanella psychromarinicola]
MQNQTLACCELPQNESIINTVGKIYQEYFPINTIDSIRYLFYLLFLNPQGTSILMVGWLRHYP